MPFRIGYLLGKAFQVHALRHNKAPEVVFIFIKLGLQLIFDICPQSIFRISLPSIPRPGSSPKHLSRTPYQFLQILDSVKSGLNNRNPLNFVLQQIRSNMNHPAMVYSQGSVFGSFVIAWMLELNVIKTGHSKTLIRGIQLPGTNFSILFTNRLHISELPISFTNRLPPCFRTTVIETQ